MIQSDIDKFIFNNLGKEIFEIFVSLLERKLFSFIINHVIKVKKCFLIQQK
jgi:hypothetical protein